MIFRQQAYSTLINISIVRHIFPRAKLCSSPTVSLNKSSLLPQVTSYYTWSLRAVYNLMNRMTSIVASGQSCTSMNAAQPKYELETNGNNLRCFKSHVSSAEWSSAEYWKCVDQLNSLTQLIAPLTARDRLEILPLFTRQLALAGINAADLNQLNIIHVSGTKGKGSTCAFVDSILRTAGLKTGFYSSPHLVKTNERIRLDGQPIEDAIFSKYFREIYDRLLHETGAANIPMPGYFSFLTILAFHIFLDQKVDAAVIEVGVGGEYDPTNVVQQPIACGISTLDYDHTNILGESLGEIAWSKAGIAKSGVPLFTVEQQQEALEVIKQRCDEKNCPIYVCEPLDCKTVMNLGIKGVAQYTNAALACQLANFFLETTERTVRSAHIHSREMQIAVKTDLMTLPPVFQQAISNCIWPGRCQIIKYPKYSFFLDGAHTKKSMENCLEWFKTNSNEGHANDVDILMVNIIGDRDRRPILLPLSTYRSYKMVIFSTNKVEAADNQGVKIMENAQNNVKVWQSLVGEHKSAIVKVVPCTSACLQLLIDMSLANPGIKYNILVTGSLHFVGTVLETLPAFNVQLSIND